MSLNPVNIIEIIILLAIIFKIYKYITGTQAEQLVKGILMLLIAMLLSKLFKLEIIGKILESIVNIVIFSLVVIFQPELRRLLGYLGQPGILSKNILNFESEEEVESFTTEIAEALRYLSKNKTGALIVIQNTNISDSYIEVGTKLNARVSTELLLTIFHPNTPLHDGAVVLSSDKIIAAGVLLPLTEDPKLSWQYGTRHRAAIGMSEVSDSVCLVVSEETGDISMAQGGILTKFEDYNAVKKELELLYGDVDEAAKEKRSKKFTFNNLLLKDFAKFPVFPRKKD